MASFHRDKQHGFIGSVENVKHEIFHKPNEAMLFVMVKAYLYLKNILLFRTFKEFIFLIIRYKQNLKFLGSIDKFIKMIRTIKMISSGLRKMLYLRSRYKISCSNDTNEQGFGVYILRRHFVVISLLPQFCREHKTGMPLIHYYFIQYTCVTSGHGW